MVNPFVTLFDDARAALRKLFTSAKHDGPAVINVINEVTPEAELVFALTDPEAAAIVDPIVNEVQGDLVTIYNMAKQGDFTSLKTLVAAVNANLASLTTAAHIKDANALAKAQSIVAAIASALNSALAAA